MALIISWSEFEAEYAKNFPTEKGAPAKSLRMALGALIIKEKLGISDRETAVETAPRSMPLQIAVLFDYMRYFTATAIQL